MHEPTIVKKEMFERPEIDSRYKVVSSYRGFDIVILKEASIDDEQGYRVNHRHKNYDKPFPNIEAARNALDADFKKNERIHKK